MVIFIEKNLQDPEDNHYNKTIIKIKQNLQKQVHKATRDFPAAILDTITLNKKASTAK